MSKITKIILHAADTPASMDIGAAEIRRWRVDDSGCLKQRNGVNHVR